MGNIFNAIMQNNAVDFILYPQGGDPWYHWGGTRIGSTLIENPMVVATAGYKDMFESTVVPSPQLRTEARLHHQGADSKPSSFKN